MMDDDDVWNTRSEFRIQNEGIYGERMAMIRCSGLGIVLSDWKAFVERIQTDIL